MDIYKLYVKTHNKTGLKYLGFTKLNPYKYKGSGIYWVRHLNIHGNDVSTDVIFESTSKADIQSMGIHYSNLWNVVDDSHWANLKPETGEGGASPRTTETKEKIRTYQKQKQWTDRAKLTRLENCIKNAKVRKGKSWSDKMRQSRLEKYITKNYDIALSVIKLRDQGLNNLQISKTLGVSWDKVKYSLLHRKEFETVQNSGKYPHDEET
jgi:hypothetical protein